MKVDIRQERSNDYEAVFKVVERAFCNATQADHKEQFLVQRLRKSSAFVPELSLVAEVDEQIVGHILLTKSRILSGIASHQLLVLAPVSVVPEFQRQGVGSKLIEAAHEKSKELRYISVVVLGHEDYYPRFGYKRADSFGISFSFDAPPENCMVIELQPGALSGVSGRVDYAKEFFE